MADRKISQLDAVSDLQDTDEFVLARAGDTNKFTGADLKLALGAGQFSGMAWTQSGGSYSNGDNLVFDTALWDTDDYANGDATPDKFYPPEDGYYMVTIHGYEDAATPVGLNVKKNDTGSPIIITYGQDTNGDADRALNGASAVDLLTTDYINVEYLTFDPGSAPDITRLTITKMGGLRGPQGPEGPPDNANTIIAGQVFS